MVPMAPIEPPAKNKDLHELLEIVRDIWEVVKMLTDQMGELIAEFGDDDTLAGWQARLQMVADREEFRA